MGTLREYQGPPGPGRVRAASQSPCCPGGEGGVDYMRKSEGYIGRQNSRQGEGNTRAQCPGPQGGGCHIAATGSRKVEKMRTEQGCLAW